MALAYVSVLSVSAALAAAPVPINVADNIAEGTSSAEKVAAASNASRMLASQLRALVADGRLKEIRIVAPDQGISRHGRALQGWYDNGVIYLTTDIVARFSTVDNGRFHASDHSTNNPDDLVFLLGFLAARAQNSGTNSMETGAMQERFKQQSSKLPAGQPVDVTSFVKDMLALQLDYAARAYINGWGVLRDAAESKNGKNLNIRDFTMLMMKSRTFPLLNAAVNKPKFVLRSDGRIPLTPDNIKAVTLALSESVVPEFD